MNFRVPLRAPRAAVAWPLRLVVLVALCLGLAACGALPRNATPAQSALDGTVPNFPDVRGWVGQTSSILEQDLVRSFAQESPQDFPTDASGTVRYAHLALSGGGANGAFGAGFLNGWTATGTRPVFKIVTGVSTGALMAPFAFIGPPYDEALRDFYTTVRSQDIFVLRSTFGLLWQLIAGEALADTLPLQAKIARHVDAPLLQRVAEAHQRGRRLYIGTANLDAPRFVVWNMGLIASSGRPDALALFRKVMLASASIPVAFAPAGEPGVKFMPYARDPATLARPWATCRRPCHWPESWLRGARPASLAAAASASTAVRSARVTHAAYLAGQSTDGTTSASTTAGPAGPSVRGSASTCCVSGGETSRAGISSSV
jgi:hypothetical protein